MDFAFYLDLVMIVLLIATIIYAVILNRKLAAFRRSREDMQNFLSAFNAANERAETSIRALKEMAEQSGEKLREDIEKAGALNEDLAFMVDRGESIANRLEKAASDVNSVRRGGAAAPDIAGGVAAAAVGRGKDRADIIDDRDPVGVETRAEELAARMVRDVERSGSASSGAARGGRNLDDDAFGGAPVDYGDKDRGNGGVADLYDQDEDAGRSDAERELLAALRSVR